MGTRTASKDPGVVVELQTNRWFRLPDALMAFATDCIAFNRNSLEKLPSGLLGDGGMKKVASVATAPLGSIVADSLEWPAQMVLASSGSSTGGRPLLMALTFCGSMSTPTTLKPRAAKVAAMHAPSLPKPQTEMDFIVFMQLTMAAVTESSIALTRGILGRVAPGREYYHQRPHRRPLSANRCV